MGNFAVSEADERPPSKFQQFGVKLEKAASRTDVKKLVPRFLSMAIEYLDKYGIDTPYIYETKPNKPNKYHNLIYDIDCGVIVDFTDTKLHKITPIDVAYLVIIYLSQLPESLLTKYYESEFLLVKKIPTKIERTIKITKLVSMLPPANRATLKALTEHLIHISSNSKVNKMTKEKLIDCLLEKKSPFKFVYMIFMENFSDIFEEVNYLSGSAYDLLSFNPDADDEEESRDSIVAVIAVPDIQIKSPEEKQKPQDIRQQWAHELRSQSIRHLSASFFIDVNVETEGFSPPSSPSDLNDLLNKLDVGDHFSSSSDDEEDEEMHKKPKKDLKIKLFEDEEDDWDEEIKTKPIKGDALKKEKKPIAKITVIEDGEDWEDSKEDMKSLTPLKSDLKRKSNKRESVKKIIVHEDDEDWENDSSLNSVQPIASEALVKKNFKSNSIKKLALIPDDDDWDDSEAMKNIKPLKGDAVVKKKRISKRKK